MCVNVIPILQLPRGQSIDRLQYPSTIKVIEVNVPVKCQFQLSLFFKPQKLVAYYMKAQMSFGKLLVVIVRVVQVQPRADHPSR